MLTIFVHLSNRGCFPTTQAHLGVDAPLAPNHLVISSHGRTEDQITHIMNVKSNQSKWSGFPNKDNLITSYWKLINRVGQPVDYLGNRQICMHALFPQIYCFHEIVHHVVSSLNSPLRNYRSTVYIGGLISSG